MKFKGKEYNEGEGSCMDCSCFDCNIRYGEEYRCTLPHGKIWIERKEKEEPKTKRMVVIWFGEVPVDKCENPMLIDEMTGYVYGQVELIDPDRLRYGNSCVSDKGQYITTDMSIEDIDNPVYNRLIIDPPTPEPEPETVGDVLKRMPKTEDYMSVDGYWCDMENFEKDLKAAQEREENK